MCKITTSGEYIYDVIYFPEVVFLQNVFFNHYVCANFDLDFKSFQFPISIILPFSITITQSYIYIFSSKILCVIIKIPISFCFSKSFSMAFAVILSNDARHSSNTVKTAFEANDLAIAIRCFSPPEIFLPSSSMYVCSCCFLSANKVFQMCFFYYFLHLF